MLLNSIKCQKSLIRYCPYAKTAKCWTTAEISRNVSSVGSINLVFCQTIQQSHIHFGSFFEITLTFDRQQHVIKLKTEISSALLPYGPNLPFILKCDASPVGIASVLSHIIDNLEWCTSFSSRFLTTAEQNYLQLVEKL